MEKNISTFASQSEDSDVSGRNSKTDEEPQNHQLLAETGKSRDEITNENNVRNSRVETTEDERQSTDYEEDESSSENSESSEDRRITTEESSYGDSESGEIETYPKTPESDKLHEENTKSKKNSKPKIKLPPFIPTDFCNEHRIEEGRIEDEKKRQKLNPFGRPLQNARHENSRTENIMHKHLVERLAGRTEEEFKQGVFVRAYNEQQKVGYEWNRKKFHPPIE